jgi:hypothetical protein
MPVFDTTGRPKGKKMKKEHEDHRNGIPFVWLSISTNN